MHRETDPTPTTRFRSDRFFASDGQWFFTTREDTVEGPFATRVDAQAGLTEYLLSLGIQPVDVWSRAGDHR